MPAASTEVASAKTYAGAPEREREEQIETGDR